jgi:predicted MFS family arabinose efflux permease
LAASRSLLILVPFLMYGPLDYALRINNAMIAPALVAEFGFGAAQLGFVTSAFFVAFALAQLPLGLALDRFGPRRVVATLLIIAALGGILYVTATGIVGLTVGRFLIGVGMAASLTGCITAGRLWFAPERLASITAVLVALTAFGGMVASGPMAALLTVVPWRGVIVGLVGMCLVVMLIVLAVVPRHDAVPAAPADRDRPWRVYGVILTSLRFWRFTPIAMGGMGVAIAYQSLWAPLWLRDVAGYDATLRAWVLFAMFTAVLFGSLGLGWLSARLGARPRALQALALGGFGMSILLQVLLAATRGGLAPGLLWTGSALFFACPMVAYAIVARKFPPGTAGRAASAVNALLFVAVFLTQWLTGVVIGAFPATADGGYAVAGHQASLWAVITLQVLALLWCMLAGRLEARASGPGTMPTKRGG